MKQKYNMVMVLMLMLSLAMQSCERDGQLAVLPIDKLSPIEFKGFVMGDTLEQYFDGIKLREFQGWARFTGNIAFNSEAPVKMELRKKSTGEVLLTETIERNRPDKPITFFYDGKKFSEKYEYPAAIENIEQIAFYFDFPADMPVDIAYGDGSDIDAVVYLARNVTPGQWTEFIQVPPLEGEMYVLLLKAGKKEYLMDNDVNYSFMSAGLILPNKDGYQGGGVQSWYVGTRMDLSTNKPILHPQTDLVAIFPR
jgi:hypothetical protein